MSYQIETQITDLIKIASIDFLILFLSFKTKVWKKGQILSYFGSDKVQS